MNEHVPGAPQEADDCLPGASQQVEKVAEQRAVAVATQVAQATGSRQFRAIEVLMLVMLAASLLIHALTLSRLFSVRGTLRDEIDRLAQAVEDAKKDQLQYEVPIRQDLPIAIDVPIRRSLVIPVQTEVRIKQNIILPIDTGFGSFDLPIPIDATIPISTSVPIEFNQTVPISANVPIQLDLPIQIDLGSEQIAPLLDRLHEQLLALRDEF